MREYLVGTPFIDVSGALSIFEKLKLGHLLLPGLFKEDPPFPLRMLRAHVTDGHVELPRSPSLTLLLGKLTQDNQVKEVLIQTTPRSSLAYTQLP